MPVRIGNRGYPPVLSGAQKGVMADLLNDPGWEKLQPQTRMAQQDENYDYDMDAWRAANPGVQVGPGQHYPDTYKKPNHMTFSTESMYHGGENQGGQWSKNDDGSWTFTAGPTNLQYHSPEELQDYFRRVEPGNTLVLPNNVQIGNRVYK